MWYYENNGQPAGPVTETELGQLIAQGTVCAPTRIWREGMEDWLPAQSTSEFSETFTPATAQVTDTGHTRSGEPYGNVGSPFASGGAPSQTYSSPFAPPQTYSHPGYGGGFRPSYAIGGPETVESIESYYRGFIISLIAGMVILPFIIGTIIAGFLMDSIPLFIVGGVLLLIFMVVWLVIVVCQFVLIYKLWSVIPPELAKTTPAMAVGLMFVPLFNIYWMFIVYYVLSQNMNDTLQSQGRARTVNETMPLVYCILAVMTCMPYVGALVGLVSLVFMFLMYNELIQGVRTMLNIPRQ